MLLLSHSKIVVIVPRVLCGHVPELYQSNLEVSSRNKVITVRIHETALPHVKTISVFYLLDILNIAGFLASINIPLIYGAIAGWYGQVT